MRLIIPARPIRPVPNESSVLGSGVMTMPLPEVIPEAPLVMKSIRRTPNLGDAVRLAVSVALVLLSLVKEPSKRPEVNSVVVFARLVTVRVPVNAQVDPT